GEELRPAAGLVLGDPLRCELAALYLAEDLPHFLPGLLGYDPLAGHIVAVFGRIADGVPHVREPALVDEVNDQLHFMDALEICDLRLVTGLDECFEPCLHQFRDPAAEHCLLSEKVSLGLFPEGGLKYAGPSGA